MLERQLFHLMKEAVEGKRFLDQWGRSYIAMEVDIHGRELHADYQDGKPAFIYSFYYCLGDQPIDDERLSKLETLPETELTEIERKFLARKKQQNAA